MFNLAMYKYAQCSQTEKQSCVPLVAQLVGLANLVRAKGVAALEAQIVHVDNDLLKDGIGLIIDGTEPDLVCDILETSILFSYKTGAELLAQLMIRDGLLCIQRGYNPKIIEVKLLRYLDEGCREEYVKREGVAQYAGS